MFSRRFLLYQQHCNKNNTLISSNVPFAVFPCTPLSLHLHDFYTIITTHLLVEVISFTVPSCGIVGLLPVFSQLKIIWCKGYLYARSFFLL